MLSDHYDPRARKVRLSASTFHEPSLAAMAVGAHEVGYVLQHARGCAPLALRSAIAPVAGFGSLLAFPLFFAGSVVFHLITLPVEFDSSKRARSELTSSGALAPNEVIGAKKVLDAAALTYVAAAAMAALQLVRLVLLRRGRD